MSDWIMMLVSDEEKDKEPSVFLFDRLGSAVYLSFSFPRVEAYQRRTSHGLLRECRQTFALVRRAVRPSGGHRFDGAGSERFHNPFFLPV